MSTVLRAVERYLEETRGAMNAALKARSEGAVRDAVHAHLTWTALYEDLKENKGREALKRPDLLLNGLSAVDRVRVEEVCAQIAGALAPGKGR